MDTIKAWITKLTKGTSTKTTTAEPTSPRDFAHERETGRVGQMSTDDQAWEAASRQRDQANTARKPSSGTE